VVYFYPADDTPGCTAEACAFRDSHEDFVDAGALVIGISGDSAESHEKFADKHSLPFTLLSDRGGAVRKLYGVKKTLGFLPVRATYVLSGNSSAVKRHDRPPDQRGDARFALRAGAGGVPV
jgi:peroxiredoxin Q/BCP